MRRLTLFLAGLLFLLPAFCPAQQTDHERVLSALVNSLEAESRAFASDSDDNVPNVAQIRLHNIVVVEGTKAARMPVSITTEHEDLTIASLWLTVTAGERVQIPIVKDDQEAWKESIFNAHPHVWRGIRPSDPHVAGYLLILWMAPFDTIKADGHLCYVTLDTSQLEPGEYYVHTNVGTSGTMATSEGNSITYRALHLDHKPGLLSVVAKGE